VTQGFLSRLEAGDYEELSLPVALRLARVLKVPVETLAK
jgi:hypothetical protein